jgi:hypothetical protein
LAVFFGKKLCLQLRSRAMNYVLAVSIDCFLTAFDDFSAWQAEMRLMGCGNPAIWAVETGNCRPNQIVLLNFYEFPSGHSACEGAGIRRVRGSRVWTKAAMIRTWPLPRRRGVDAIDFKLPYVVGDVAADGSNPTDYLGLHGKYAIGPVVKPLGLVLSLLDLGMPHRTASAGVKIGHGATVKRADRPGPSAPMPKPIAPRTESMAAKIAYHVGRNIFAEINPQRSGYT